MSRLVKAGFEIFLPFGSGSRCDLVAEKDGKLIRVQCKNGAYRNGAVVFRTANQTKAGLKSYVGEVDVFAVYCQELDRVYLVPVEVCGLMSQALRVDLPRNNQAKRVELAKAYEV